MVSEVRLKSWGSAHPEWPRQAGAAGEAATLGGQTLETMTVLEEVARLAYDTVVLNAAARPIPDGLRDKHFFRKHGPGAYYGQQR